VNQIVYSSAAVSRFAEVELASLLLRARKNNERLGVSGLLLHHGGSFLQVLEGDSEVVNALFATIGKDKRHHRIVKLLNRDVGARQFAEWKMGFVSVDALSHPLPGFSDFMRHRSKDDAKTADAAQRVLAAFRDGRFRSHVAV